MWRNLEDHRRLAERDAPNVERLRKQLGRKPMIKVPELPGDVHDLAGLAEMNEYLFAPGALLRRAKTDDPIHPGAATHLAGTLDRGGQLHRENGLTGRSCGSPSSSMSTNSL